MPIDRQLTEWEATEQSDYTGELSPNAPQATEPGAGWFAISARLRAVTGMEPLRRSPHREPPGERVERIATTPQ